MSECRRDSCVADGRRDQNDYCSAMCKNIVDLERRILRIIGEESVDSDAHRVAHLRLTALNEMILWRDEERRLACGYPPTVDPS